MCVCEILRTVEAPKWDQALLGLPSLLARLRTDVGPPEAHMHSLRQSSGRIPISQWRPGGLDSQKETCFFLELRLATTGNHWKCRFVFVRS